MRKIGVGLLLAGALFLAGCTSAQLTKFNSGINNFFAGVTTLNTNIGNTIVAVNADIAASAPTVAKACGDLQTVAMLLQPYFTNGKGPQYFGAANGALSAYCTAIPTDIAGTAAQVIAAKNAAQAGYNQVKAGS